MVKSCKIELWTNVAPTDIVSPDHIISQSLIIYDTVVAKTFFEPQSVRVTTSELFILSYTAIFLLYSLYGEIRAFES